MQVLKFGGTSVANAENINKTVSIVKQAIKNDKTIVVASAISGCTDTLLEIINLAKEGNENWNTKLSDLHEKHISIISELISIDYKSTVENKINSYFIQLKNIINSIWYLKDTTDATTDWIVGFGELISTTIIAEKFIHCGFACKWVDARELIITEKQHKQNIVVTDKTYLNIQNQLSSEEYRLFIVPGFISSDISGKPSTLGRGGSDYTAALIAAAIDARALEIWTDVNGMMTADPRIVPNAKTIEHLSYKEALELSHFGAKVIYPATIQPIIKKGIPILVKNTFDPQGKGTLIEKNPPERHESIKGISGSKNIALLSMEGSGMIGVPGYSGRLFSVLAKNDINIILITQASSVHTMLVAIDECDAIKAKKTADDFFAYEISLGKIQPLKVETGFSIISIVGDDMKNQSGAAARMFEAIGSRGINIRAIAHGSSEKNVSAVVSAKHFNEAVNAVHEEFFEDNTNYLNLFIAGYGNVGKALVEIIERRKEKIKEETGISLNIIGIANTKSMVFDLQGLDISNTEEQISVKRDNNYNTQDFIDNIIKIKLKNSVFIDCTSSFEISTQYQKLLSEKVRIVTSNKIANSLDMSFYKGLHAAAKQHGTSFSYETNVGAALPIISTLRQMLNSGDKIHKIEATMSGSLNFIFNNYDTTSPFIDIIKKACELGYTEPDPRTDLKGVDLQRKALILGREIGLDIEMSDIVTEQFLPKEYFNGSVDDFYKKVEENESFFSNLYKQSYEKKEKLIYSFSIGEEKIELGLKPYDNNHPFCLAKDTDNVIIIYSDFYPNGFKIQGAGAGSWQTASGLLSNILTS